VSSNIRIIIIGASSRAAAFSALRAGLKPWCADLFGDTDLRRCCAVMVISASIYPQGLFEAVDHAPPGPWMYTGGLENHPRLLQRLCRFRFLWGNDGRTVAQVRSPLRLTTCLAEADLFPLAIHTAGSALPSRGHWLLKPYRGSGGKGIGSWRPGMELPRRGFYLQQFAEGESCAACYLANGRQTHFLGATRQLVGAAWLHAERFQYCGSLGPLPVSKSIAQMFTRLGRTIADRFALRGLFGIDCILQREHPRVVEINPRYTASMEVLEYAMGSSMLKLHEAVFTGANPVVPAHVSDGYMGKAILFAKDSLMFPIEGPWSKENERRDPEEYPDFADIPSAGSLIQRGQPVLTFFARGLSETSCLAALKDRARDLDHWLFER
jgi:predicted ATP-grasp superfamily ATP-dependent carboligase